MTEVAWGGKLSRLLRNLRGGSDDPSSRRTAMAAEPAGTYGDWSERFMALTDHTGVIARTTAIPALVAVGQHLDQLCAEHKEALDEMGSWRPSRWPVWPDSAILVDGTLKMFEVIERVLAMAAGAGGAAENDPLESAWNESTVALLNEAVHLKSEFIVGVGLATDGSDPGAK